MSAFERRNDLLDTKSVVFRISIGLLIIAVFYIAGWGNLSDGGTGGDLGKQLGNIGAEQRKVEDCLDKAERGIESITNSIGESIKQSETITKGLSRMQVRFRYGSDLFEDSTVRIRQCREVIREAKEKGSTNR